MTSLAGYLHQFVRDLTAQGPHLEAELKQIEARKFDIEQKLKQAHLARDRADRFVAASGLNIYCPNCWIREERHVAVTSYDPGERSKTDHWRCEGCGYAYET